ncbi:HEAT repeat domain-containing protein [Salininema proteolyticum]|uniref:HEAT repeat domain-containing protein n=1 Tax=Salininema proteolyticum TaxID=1607685 RepID=A0ABV8U3S5_9ACTN
MVPINTTHTNPQHPAHAALAADNPSTRLNAALAAGTDADPALTETLITRCAIEPDLFVRDMLTWALTRLPAQATLPALCEELRSEHPQARSQALHTLSKIADTSAWPAITPSLLHDADDEVARSAWRAAVALVPDDQKEHLAAQLARQLGRGGRETQLSLSRALAALGEAALPALHAAETTDDPVLYAHATATERLLDDPEAGFELAIAEAKRVVALGGRHDAGTAC